MAKFPTFKSPFLNHICQQLAARGKAIKHSADLKWETKQPDEFEWLTVNITPVVGHYTVFQFTEDNLGSLYVRSKSRADRGKILLQIKNINLIDNAAGIVEAIETTVNNSRALKTQQRSEANQEIRAAWSNVEMRVVYE
jgi:hypothetical protein